ncbi:MAG: GtrA family protein [Pseudolysinimonas sp.]
MKRAFAYVRHQLLGYALKFGVVGLICFAIDVGIFNLLRSGVFGTGHFFSEPIGAKITSSVISTVIAWLANRFWTFRERRRSDVGVEFLEFGAVGAVGIGIGVACVAISHYALGFTSLLADNIAANVVGLVLGTTFRFLMYRYWVFSGNRRKSISATPEPAAIGSDVIGTDA